MKIINFLLHSCITVKTARFGVFLLFFVSYLASAQATLPDKRMDFQKKKWKWWEKVERKVSYSPSLGFSILPQDIPLTEFGFPKNVYAGFPLAPTIGIGAHYSVSGHVFLQAGADLFFTAKDFRRMVGLSLSFGPKFYLFTQKRKFSPYLTIGGSFSSLRYVEKEHTDVYKDFDSNLITFGEVTQVERRFPEQRLNVAPILGAYLGGGLEFRLNRKYSFYIQGTYNPTINSNSKVIDFFPENQSQMRYFQVKAGVNIKLFKKPPPVIDTNTIFIPDEIAILDVPEDGERRGMLVREGIFDMILREGLKHDVRVSTGSHELMIDEEVQDPCKVTCYLFDDNGDIISTAESSPEGKIVFTDLAKGVYDVAFQLEKPCTSANFKYSFPDPTTQVVDQQNSKAISMDSVTYNVEGSIQMPDTTDYSFVYKSSALFLANNENLDKRNFDVHVMLSNADNRIIRHFDPKPDEKFAFKKLPPPADYDIIYKAPDAEAHTGYRYTLSNNFKKPIRKVNGDNSCDTIPTETRDSGEQIKYTMRGKVDFIDSLTKADDVTLYLVNCYKKVVSTRKPDADGTFVFKNLHNKNDYTVFYEIDDSRKKIELLYRIEDPVALAASKNIATVTEVKVISGDMQSWNEHTEYDTKGSIVTPKGFAIQVGASDNINSINVLCKRLMDDGFNPLTIQVLGTENLNRRFSFSKNFKMFRVLVGQFSDEKLAVKEKYKLEFYGYDAYVVKHFD